MDMLQVFHMNKGQGEDSYAKNCIVQDKILSLTKSFVEEAIQGILDKDAPETMVIADLGCSSGPTALDAVTSIINAVNARCRNMDLKSPPRFMVFLNDLPGNDFNGVFASLGNFHEKLKDGGKSDEVGHCFVAGLPGSFYGRLLPPNSLHFVHSSSSLHWLSQVPPGLGVEDEPKIQNKGKIYISTSSSSETIQAYKQQFRNDFHSFLRSRSEEVISGGRMVFTLMGKSSADDLSSTKTYYCPWEFLVRCLMSMVSEGIVEEKRVDSFNVPYYSPSPEELKQIVEEESSFREHQLEAVEIEWDGGTANSNDIDECCSCDRKVLTKGERVAKMHRAVTEALFEHHFGGHILDELFLRYSKILDLHLINYNPNFKFICLVVSLIRI